MLDRRSLCLVLWLGGLSVVSGCAEPCEDLQLRCERCVDPNQRASCEAFVDRAEPTTCESQLDVFMIVCD
jgi:hypothetical protein